MPFVDCVKRIEESASPWLARHLEDIHRRMRAGVGATSAEDLVSTGLFDNDTEDEMLICGRSGSLETFLGSVSDRVVARTIAKFDAVSRAIQLFVLVGMGGTIFWMMSAIMDLSDTFGKSFER